MVGNRKQWLRIGPQTWHDTHQVLDSLDVNKTYHYSNLDVEIYKKVNRKLPIVTTE